MVVGLGFYLWTRGDRLTGVGSVPLQVSARPGSKRDRAVLSPMERRRILALAIVTVFVVFFWLAFEQIGSSLNLFAAERTDRAVGSWLAALVPGADSDAGTHPRMKASTPVFWAPDHDWAVAFQRGSHAVGTAGPFRPGEPGGQVAVRGSVKDAPTSPGRQDASIGVGHGDETVEAVDLPSSGCRQAAELGEHDIVVDRVCAYLARGGRPVQAGVDLVLLSAPVPRHEDFGPDPLDSVCPGGESLPGGSGPLEVVACKRGPARCG